MRLEKLPIETINQIIFTYSAGELKIYYRVGDVHKYCSSTTPGNENPKVRQGSRWDENRYQIRNQREKLSIEAAECMTCMCTLVPCWTLPCAAELWTLDGGRAGVAPARKGLVGPLYDFSDAGWKVACIRSQPHVPYVNAGLLLHAAGTKDELREPWSGRVWGDGEYFC